ncbi:hypothetical protein [Escherichia coli]|uniref:hypothetical protein n=1 Tax=Escherichia coli TaxID=562 RepID=UPI0013616456|nr:hypothetical protein [Escherichia coli]MDI0796281.1 hypothetical protein [Escherichia coli]NAQ36225.1 hypothetical protein [Escherichia coli]
MIKFVISFLFFVLYSVSAYGSDCAVIYSFPLTLTGAQSGLSWSGSVGGHGVGSYISTCPKPYKYDYRYNIVSKNAVCTNQADSKNYIVTVSTIGASVDTGAMERYPDLYSGNESFEVWGKSYPAGGIPLAGSAQIYGFYTTRITMDISSLPVGSFSCVIKNTHGAYGSETNNPESGSKLIFNRALSLGASGWATGRVNVSVNSACRINNDQGSLDVRHDNIVSGSDSIKVVSVPIICNKNSSIVVRLSGGMVQNDGVLINVGESKSLVSVSVYDGGEGAARLSMDVASNVNTSVFVRSKLKAKGGGRQSGNIIMSVTYN